MPPMRRAGCSSAWTRARLALDAAALVALMAALGLVFLFDRGSAERPCRRRPGRRGGPRQRAAALGRHAPGIRRHGKTARHAGQRLRLYARSP